MSNTMKAARAGAVLLACAAAACDDGGVGPEGSRQVSISLATRGGAQASLMGAAAVPLADNQGNTLTITQMQIVIEELALERADGDDDDCDASGPGNPCEEFEEGPFLVNLPVNGGTVTITRQPIPAGRYEELELKVDRPDEGDASHVAFRAANPNWPAIRSMRVVGTFNGNPFDIFLDVEAELELEFDDPLVVSAENGTLNITLALDLQSLFLTSGGTFLDPRVGGGALADLVEKNLDRAFDAFKDDDKDGDDDDD